MSHDRSDRILLPPVEGRCEPLQACTMRTRCARYLATIPQGASLGDWSASGGYGAGTALCSGYLDANGLRLAQEAGKAKTHPSAGRLS
jgi:hypothetical protein